jgi:Macrocin-O-methyltransferase (TylF)
MIEEATIWLRRRLADINECLRELMRRQVRKLVELIVTDTDLMARLRDAATTAAFEERQLRDAAGYKSRGALHRAILREVAGLPGLHLEFGVYKGDSINHFAELAPNVTWYGFDSFEGLPEAWTLGAKTGAFSVGGKLPPVRANVRLTKGFFEATLPPFVAQHPGEAIALLHIDCDLYSSTVTILNSLGGMLVPGSIVLFDELINYHGWEEGEYKAFMEFAAARKLAFEYIAYNRTGGQVAVRILDTAEPAAPADHVAATGP